MIELTPETQALARRPAEAEQRAVYQALESRASFLRPDRPLAKASPEFIAARRKEIDDFVAKVAAAPVLDPRSPQEIMDDLNPL